MIRPLAPRALATSLIAATGLAALALLPQAAGLMVAGTAALWVSPAMAANNIPGAGLVIKRRPGDVPIVAPTDASGNLVLTGLEAAEYEVKLIGTAQSIIVPVGLDGRLAVSVRRNKGRQWVALAGRGVRGAGIDVGRTFAVSPPIPCARPMPGTNYACPGRIRYYADVNESTAAHLTQYAPAISAQAAQVIVDERTKNGKFSSPADFANRVCPKVSVDFGFAPVVIADTRIIARASGPRSQGWQCAPARQGQEPVVVLYGRKHTYVGHVTLLR